MSLLSATVSTCSSRARSDLSEPQSLNLWSSSPVFLFLLYLAFQLSTIIYNARFSKPVWVFTDLLHLLTYLPLMTKFPLDSDSDGCWKKCRIAVYVCDWERPSISFCMYGHCMWWVWLMYKVRCSASQEKVSGCELQESTVSISHNQWAIRCESLARLHRTYVHISYRSRYSYLWLWVTWWSYNTVHKTNSTQ